MLHIEDYEFHKDNCIMVVLFSTFFGVLLLHYLMTRLSFTCYVGSNIVAACFAFLHCLMYVFIILSTLHNLICFYWDLTIDLKEN